MNKRRLNDVTPEEWDAMYSLQLQLQPVVPDKAAEAAKMHIHHVSSVVNASQELVNLYLEKKTLH